MKKLETGEYEDKVAETFIVQKDKDPQNDQSPDLKVETEQPQREQKNASMSGNNLNTGEAQSPTR